MGDGCCACVGFGGWRFAVRAELSSPAGLLLDRRWSGCVIVTGGRFELGCAGADWGADCRSDFSCASATSQEQKVAAAIAVKPSQRDPRRRRDTSQFVVNTVRAPSSEDRRHPNEAPPKQYASVLPVSVSTPRPTCLRVTTLTAGLLAHGSTPSAAFPGASQWQDAGRFTVYSCGGSRGFGDDRPTAFPYRQCLR